MNIAISLILVILCFNHVQRKLERKRVFFFEAVENSAEYREKLEKMEEAGINKRCEAYQKVLLFEIYWLMERNRLGKTIDLGTEQRLRKLFELMEERGRIK